MSFRPTTGNVGIRASRRSSDLGGENKRKTFGYSPCAQDSEFGPRSALDKLNAIRVFQALKFDLGKVSTHATTKGFLTHRITDCSSHNFDHRGDRHSESDARPHGGH